MRREGSAHMAQNKETIYLARPQECTGCAACVNICPVNALTMKPDKRGFVTPVLNEVLCIDCLKCQKICPVLENPKGSMTEPGCYAATAKDEIRRTSTSGGVFPLLAKHILLKGGIVCGATMDDKFNVKHVCISSVSDLLPIQGSKYVQSDIGLIYRQVEHYLKEDKTVLFSGCPCQVAGLKNYLGKDYSDLFLIDLLCFGVPSQQIFNQYLNENVDLSNVQTVFFRDKTRGWVPNTLTLKLKDGSQLIHTYEKCEFEQAFHNRLFLRESCYDCPFSDFPRQGDLSLGDFWGVEQFDKALNDQKGTSIILVNSEKGEQMLGKIRSEMVICTPVPLEYPLKINRLHSKIAKHPGRDYFWELLKKYSFNKAANYALHDRHDIGVIGCWSVENHGSNMSYYALYRVLRDMGLEPLMIERPADSLWPPHDQPEVFAHNPYRACDLAPIYHNKSEMKALNQKCDTFLLGSDQLLYHDLYNSFNEFADMSYIHANKKKIAYATSVGREEFEGTEEQRAKLSLWLKQFDFISVREDSGVSMLHNTFGVEVQWVLDPVFLCPPHYYTEMARYGKPFSLKPYMAVYTVDPDPQKDAALRYASKQTGLSSYIFTDVASSGSEVKKATNEDWLRSIMECDFFITDSFHGACFAIIFHKPFICIANPYRGLSRFTSLLGQLGLMDRLVSKSAEIMHHPELFEPVDYACVDTILKENIRKSQKWLEQAVRAPFRKPISYYDLLDDRLDELGLRLKQAKENIYTIETWLSNTHQRVEQIEPIVGRIDGMELQMKQARESICATETWLSNTHQRVERLEPVIGRTNELEIQLMQAQESIHATETWLSNTHQRIERIEPVIERINGMELQLKQVKENIVAIETWLSNTHQRVERIEPIISRIDAMERLLVQIKTRPLLEALRDHLGKDNLVVRAIKLINKDKRKEQGGFYVR
jgi:coenzyme F420-reducing hydrogenase beta subunit/ferritin-like metal-binding protein YciE